MKCDYYNYFDPIVWCNIKTDCLLPLIMLSQPAVGLFSICSPKPSMLMSKANVYARHHILRCMISRPSKIVHLSQTANLDRALSFAPYIHRANMPNYVTLISSKVLLISDILTIPITLRPPSTLMPLPTPRLTYIGRPNRTQPNANRERQKSFPAKSEAAYCG